MRLEDLTGMTIEVAPKHTGWTRTLSFSRWTKYGKDRLYVRYHDRDRHGKSRNHGQEKGYVDLVAGEIVGPTSLRMTIKKILNS